MRIAGSPKRIVADLLVLLILAATYWYVWLREPTTEALQGVESVELSMRYLWDPESLQLQEWQVLANPIDILLGPYGELFISDGDHARVLRCTTEGEFIESIGRRGAGPGEFEECWDLGYCETDSTLWVADRSTVRGFISRFRLTSSSSQFVDRFASPHTRLQTRPNLVVQDAHSFWAHDRSVRAEMRILQIDDQGELIASFGEPYEHPDATTGRDRSMISAYSMGSPELVGQERLLYVYMSRPVMELWSTSGDLLDQREFDLPEIRSITRGVQQLQGESTNPMVGDPIPVYFGSPIWHPASSAVYVMTLDYARNRQVIYAVNPDDFQILARYLIAQDGEEHFLNGLAVQQTSTGVRFFSIDGRSAGVVVLEPGQT